jgi:hypothetical protein
MLNSEESDDNVTAEIAIVSAPIKTSLMRALGNTLRVVPSRNQNRQR